MEMDTENNNPKTGKSVDPESHLFSCQIEVPKSLKSPMSSLMELNRLCYKTEVITAPLYTGLDTEDEEFVAEPSLTLRAEPEVVAKGEASPSRRPRVQIQEFRLNKVAPIDDGGPSAGQRIVFTDNNDNRIKDAGLQNLDINKNEIPKSENKGSESVVTRQPRSSWVPVNSNIMGYEGERGIPGIMVEVLPYENTCCITSCCYKTR